jgi:hypothetical protein
MRVRSLIALCFFAASAAIAAIIRLLSRPSCLSEITCKFGNYLRVPAYFSGGGMDNLRRHGRARPGALVYRNKYDHLLEWRKEFPNLDRATYLISHSLGAMPRRTADALQEFAETWASRGILACEEGWWKMPEAWRSH